MKKLYVLFILLALCACNEGEEYDLSDGYPNLNTSNGSSNEEGSLLASMATVLEVNDNGRIVLLQDNGLKVYVSNPSILTNNSADHVGDRLFYTYYIQNEKENCIIYIVEMQKADVLSPETEVPAGSDDPISIVGANRALDYMNIQFQYQGNKSRPKGHTFHVVINNPTPYDGGYISLSLRHNANGDKAEETYIGYASVLLKELPNYSTATLKGVDIHYYSLDKEEKTVRLELR